MRIFTAVVVILTVIAGYGIALAVGDLTFLSKSVVWSGCGLVSAIIGLASWRSWRVVTRSDSMWFNYVINLVGLTGIMAGVIYGVNFWGASDSQPGRELKLPVERLARETHYRTKRVGRRNVGQEPYQVYRAYYLMPYGERKFVTLRVEDFSKARRTDSVEVRIVKGLLGAEVIKSQRLRHSVPKKRSSFGRTNKNSETRRKSHASLCLLYPAI